MDEAVRFFMILNFISILVYLQEDQDSDDDDWLTDFILLANIASEDIGLQVYSSETPCDNSCSTCMINCSSNLFSSAHLQSARLDISS